MDYLFDISIIIITYNPIWDKLVKTLDSSSIVQKKISFEVIVCDDGSDIKFKEELQKYFSVKSFKEYKLIFHDRNNGTVSNFYSGLKLASGKYTKVISPGDYFTETEALGSDPMNKI
ncbi:MAG: glycosyltransferase [Lachnospiraceae bacterium]|nr:glycosyltransferase [Lachnospiraceae bacterium]